MFRGCLFIKMIIYGGTAMRAHSFTLATLAAGCFSLFLGGCGAPLLQYQTNGEVLLDLAQKSSDDAASRMSKPNSTKVAVINMNGFQEQASYPSAVLYDMLTMSLTKQGVSTVERDVEPLYYALVEGWSQDLHFRLSKPCGELCEARKLAAKAAQEAAARLAARAEAKKKGKRGDDKNQDGLDNCLTASGGVVIAEGASIDCAIKHSKGGGELFTGK